MQRRCSSSYCNPTCSCSSSEHHICHHNTTTTTVHGNSFSMLFSMPNHHNHKTFDAYEHPMIMTSPSSSVDCTLSLSTPSSTTTAHRKSNVSKLCGWNIFQTTKQKKPPTTISTTTVNNKLNSRGGSNADSGLTSRRCANCDTTSTPLWRNGPKGPKSLCNACGIRYKKEERRATATNGSTGAAAVMSMEAQEQEQQQQQHYPWTTQHSQQSHMMPSTCPVTEFRFIEDDDRQYQSYMNSSGTGSGGGGANIPFLSWLPERPSSLVHDYI